VCPSLLLHKKGCQFKKPIKPQKTCLEVFLGVFLGFIGRGFLGGVFMPTLKKTGCGGYKNFIVDLETKLTLVAKCTLK
jgi:hypothetical protein